MHVSNLLQIDSKRRAPIIRQSEASECGISCLAMIAAYYGLEMDMPTFRRRFPVSLRGTTLKSIIQIADSVGLECRALRIEVDEVKEVQLPAILHWNLNHFVVLVSVRNTLRGKRYLINDPAKGVTLISEKEFSQSFTGVVLEVSKTERFKSQNAKSNFKISQLWSSINGAISTLISVFVVSFILQIISLVAPFYLQLALDNVLPAMDSNLLNILAVGFGGLVIIEALTGWLRSVALLNMTSSFSFQIINNLYRHLVTLPLSWFEKRHVGDVVSRFGSTQPITDFVSAGMMSAVLDGLMASMTLLLMFVYSPTLAGVALTASFLYALLRIASFATMRQSNVNSITANALENSAFIETMRGIMTIKAFGQEIPRQRIWQRLKANAVNAQLKLGRLSASFDAFAGVILAGERVVFVYLAVALAMKGGFTLGMIFAFQAYKTQFLNAATRLVDQGLQYRLIDVHLTRIADIALTRTEPVDTQPYRAEFLKGQIELRGVSFRYGLGDPFILRDINLRIEAGEMVAFVGPSGGGKTTLLKIIMGLLEPTAGSVLIDGQSVSHLGLKNWRSKIGSVMQGDQLFAGSLAENISFFDIEIDMERVKDSCRRAAILEEIEAMPLRFETLVGDMGSSLSGGQQQRVMLARALYANPAVLFMDEGTANLDPAAEAAIVNTLGRMSSTRLVSAHRPLAVLAASRVFLVQGGAINQLAKPTVTKADSAVS